MFEHGPRQMVAVIGFPNVVDVIVRVVFGCLQARKWFVQCTAQITLHVAQVVKI